MSQQDCINALQDTFHFLSDSQLRDYVNDIMDRARSYQDLGPRASIERAKAEAFDKVAQQYFDAARVSLENQRKFETASATLATKKVTTRDYLGSNPDNLNLQGLNIQSSQRAVANALGNLFYKDLDKNDVNFFINDDNKMQVAQGWMDALFGTKSDISKEAQKLGAAFKAYTDEASHQMVKSSILSVDDLNKNRFMRTVHNPARMMGTFLDKAKAAAKFTRMDVSKLRERWINYIYDRLDLEKTFPTISRGVGAFFNDDIRQVLSDSFDKITQGADKVRMQTSALTDLKQIEKQRHMFFVWKDAKSFVEYNSEYGHGTLPEALLADIHSVGAKVGMANIFGTRPAAMFDHLHKVQDKVNPKGGVWWHTTGNMFKQVTGEGNIIVSPTLAQYGSNLRQWTSAARLPMLVAQSLGDFNMGASWLSRFMGENVVDSTLKYWGNVGKQFSSYWRQFSDAELKKVISDFRVHIDSHGGYMGRFASAENMGRWTNYLSSKYYKAIGAVAHDRGNQAAVIASSMRALGQQLDLSFKELPSLWQKTMRQFNFTPAEWDTLRKEALSAQENVKPSDRVVALDHVLSIPDNAIEDLQSHLPGTPLNKIRDNLYLKLFSFYDTGAQHAILHPGAYEKAIMYQGTKPGTWTGEAIRTMMQFKGFPISYLSRQLFNGFKNADGVQAKMYWAAQQFIYTLPLSVLSTYLWYRGQGVTMPDPTKMSQADATAFALQILAPNLGVLQAGFDPTNQNPDLAFSLLASPSSRVVGSALAAPIALAEGDTNKAAKLGRNILTGLLPSTALPGASPYIKEVLGQKVHLQPGQQQLYGGH